MKILITGAAGFVGYYVCKKLLEQGNEVIGIDNLNEYYSVELKYARLNQLREFKNFNFHKTDIFCRDEIYKIIKSTKASKIIHLAAQAGVRYSLENPKSYVDSNLVGFVNMLEASRMNDIEHLIFASSSSVYGANTKVPFSVSDPVDKPVSLYAATKRANELIAYTYSHLYKIPLTGLRFFTVYGPWGRPDMAYFTFTKAISEGKAINVYNYGRMKRDFTYIDDIVNGILGVLEIPPKGNKVDPTPYKLYNIGNNKPVELNYFIKVLEKIIGKQAIQNFLPMQPGDVLQTYADIDELIKDTGFTPTISIEEGLLKFVEWYQEYSNFKY